MLAAALGLPEAAGDQLVAWSRGREARANLPDQPPGELPGPLVVPRQLPAGVRHFVGRAAELERLSGLLEEGAAGAVMVVSAIGGMAGIGKPTF